MLDLSQVTLIALGNKNVPGMVNALEYSSRNIKWGAIKLITELNIKTIDEWNHAIVFDLRKYVETPFCMLVHPDGFVVNAESWRPEFLDYDYIGAPWPLPNDDYSYRTPDGEIVRVGNSVSIRSKEMLELPYQLELAWHPYYGNTNEDGFLTCHNRRLFQQFGARFAPLEVAKHFSREMDISENMDIDKPFAFHLHDTKIGRNKEYEYLVK